MNRGVLLIGLVWVSGCFTKPVAEEPDLTELAVGESREVELYAIRLDVTDFTEEVTKAKVLSLPASVRQNLWLYDLDMTGESGRPRLLDNTMAQIKAMDVSDPSLTQAERNMVRLLSMTPDTADLSRTSMEPLLDIAPKVGFAAAEILAEAVGIGVEDSFLSDHAVTSAVVDAIIRSHPNALYRPGKKTDDNPDGLVPVPWGHLPVTLEDAASDMTSLATRFGPYQQDGVYHPGFVVDAYAELLGDDFKMILKANANALPYKGVDLTSASRGNVASIGKESAPMFDFSDPDWIQIEGLQPTVVVERMVFQILEHPEFLPGSSSPLPTPTGNSPVWIAPSWTLEHLVARAGLNMYGDHQFYKEYYLTSPDNPLFVLDIDAGWMTITTLGDVGSPPPPLYIWDLFLEVAQARLHDGPDPANPAADPIAEGEAHVRFTLTDIEVGITAEQVADAIRLNLEEDPSGLISVAGVLLDQSAGVPDFFYYRPRPDGTEASEGDWLYYITADDLPLDDNGAPVRDFADYTRLGFFADPDLTLEISAPTPSDGDILHRKIEIEPGDLLYAGDDSEKVYSIEVLDKPSRAKVALRIERLR